ncbi:MAG: transcription termination factor NusA [Spirochaetaceae bacterium]|jgi:N utilization substance protein A|nr:transcription termination factor NusA [Spirochaetaceae bacterium]
MATDVSEAIEQIVQDRNMSEELAIQIVENTILAAYKRKFGNNDNAVVRFDDGGRVVTIHAKKQVVNGVFDPVYEIELEEAKLLNPDAEEDDEILIELDPKEDFGRIAVQSAKQTARQNMREIRKDSLYSEYKDKEGDIIIGYYQRKSKTNDTIYVDLGKIEGVLPKKFQSPREDYHVNDRIKALIYKVEKTATGLQIVLSRTHTDFVKAVFEMEVPEVYDKTIEIHKIVREPGYRTKLAVYSTNRDIDPVAACVGPKGSRIQAIIRELEGEKIDVLEYSTDSREFIMNALSPAEARDVIILDEGKHQALAVVAENQLSLAIGKQGQNVRLANRLVDWSIDVKTVQQYEAMDIYTDARKAVSALFSEEEEEISRISELPGVDAAVAELLRANGVDLIDEFFAAEEDGRLASIEGLDPEQIRVIRGIIDELTVEEEFASGGAEAAGAEAANADEPRAEGSGAEAGAAEAAPEAPAAGGAAADEDVDEDEYFCPECGAEITISPDSATAVCPNCGTELSLEEEEE